MLVGGARGGRGPNERSLGRRKTLDARLRREKWKPRLDEHLPERPQAGPILSQPLKPHRLRQPPNAFFDCAESTRVGKIASIPSRPFCYDQV